jgi:L-fucose mutarotase
MLIGIDPVLTPELLHALAAMGHGDRLVIVDNNYPGTRGQRLVRLAGVDAPRALQAVLSLLPCDTFVDAPAAVMQVVGAPDEVPPVVHEIDLILAAHGWPASVGIERHEFYAAAESAWTIVQTGERRFYGNIMLTKGVIPPEGV